MPSALFTPLTQRSITFRNRIGVSPMCMYSCNDGLANDWHLVHLGSRASGGAGVVIAEATAVEARGRISPHDLGLWSDAHVEPLIPVTRFMREHGAVPAVQLAHAGRKAGTARPWDGGKPLTDEQGGWQPVGASPIAFSPAFRTPTEIADPAVIVEAFKQSARRALAAGFQLIELHAAHGYLMHSFHSPLSNHRTDRYGGSFENRTRLTRETARAVREVWPESLPLWVRFSCTDWLPGDDPRESWTLDQSVELARLLKLDGVDCIDCSSGGAIPNVAIPSTPGYQVPFASRIKREAGIATAAVGMITTPGQADGIIADAHADFALLARESLRDPHFPIHAAQTLGDPLPLPNQYARAF